MKIIGIETSCDETAVSLITRGDCQAVLKECIKTQIDIHAKFGGVVPEIASRTHFEAIDQLMSTVLDETGIRLKEIDLLAFTQGPGLVGSLLIGLAYAKALAYKNRIPLVPVDHIHAHIEAAFISHANIKYPLLALIVSGGHTSLFYQQHKFDLQLVSKTRDDAVGELMDKVAKFFNLGYPGGPLIDKLYPSGNCEAFKFTQPKMSDGSADFSFSGYKTAVLRYASEKNIVVHSTSFYDLISSLLKSVVTNLLNHTLQAAAAYNVKTVVVGGGVSLNSLLRKTFQEKLPQQGIGVFFPEPRYCADNASMIAWLGYEKFIHFPTENYFDYTLNAYSRSPFRQNHKHR
jgi:N6-L-threonylcarbamoyladenine synthase